MSLSAQPKRVGRTPFNSRPLALGNEALATALGQIAGESYSLEEDTALSGLSKRLHRAGAYSEVGCGRGRARNSLGGESRTRCRARDEVDEETLA